MGSERWPSGLWLAFPHKAAAAAAEGAMAPPLCADVAASRVGVLLPLRVVLTGLILGKCADVVELVAASAAAAAAAAAARGEPPLLLE